MTSKYLALSLLQISCLALPHAAMAVDRPLEMTASFDHAEHVEKVFKPEGIQCAQCHNFEVDPKTSEARQNAELRNSSFKLPKKELCHQCHRSAEAKWQKAPKTCYTCHRSQDSLSSIKPSNHLNVSWKTAHSTMARIDGDSCLNCHMVSQCAKCHLRRNDIEMQNHSRNFRFMHSIIAREAPQRCDACHTNAFCVNCHLGGGG